MKYIEGNTSWIDSRWRPGCTASLRWTLLVKTVLLLWRFLTF